MLVQGHLSEEAPPLSFGNLAEAGSQGPAASFAGKSLSLFGGLPRDFKLSSGHEF